MNYLKLSTMEYPLQEGDIRLEHPEITEDQTGDTFPTLDDYIEVQPTDIPAFDYQTQKLILGTPILVDGVWKQVWNIEELTEDDIAKRTKAAQFRVTVMGGGT